MKKAFVLRRGLVGAIMAAALVALGKLAMSAPDVPREDRAAVGADAGAPAPKSGTAPPAGESAAPPTTETPVSATERSTPASESLEALRAEHEALKDALFRSRARRQTVENALLDTQLGTVLTWDGGRRYVLAGADLRLDGVRLWESREAIQSGKPVTLAPRGTPAGIHVIGLRVEVKARDNPRLGYVSEQSFSFSLPEGKKTTVKITVDEDGSLPSYNPDIEIDIDVD